MLSFVTTERNGLCYISNLAIKRDKRQTTALKRISCRHGSSARVWKQVNMDYTICLGKKFSNLTLPVSRYRKKKKKRNASKIEIKEL